MGVNIREMVEKSCKTITIEDLRGKGLAIDAMNWMYQFLAIIRGFDGKPLKNYKGTITSHLMGLFHRNLNFLEYDIKPVYIFDGKPSDLKMRTIEKRRAIKIEAQKKMEEAEDDYRFEDAKKFAQATSRITPTMIEDAKELLGLMGIPVVQAPREGEAQASYMVKHGSIFACASQDYDCFLFGAPRLVRNLSISQTKKVARGTVKTKIEFFSMESVKKELELTQEQLIDVGILVGTDFWPSMRGVGLKTALNLVKEHGSLEKMIDTELVVKKVPVTNFITKETYDTIKSVFSEPEILTEYKSFLKWRRPQFDKIYDFLVNKQDFDPMRVENNLKRLKAKVVSGRQTTIENFVRKKKRS